MNIHFGNERSEAVVPVVVALNEYELAVQSLFKLFVFINTAFFTAFEDKVAEKEDRIVRLNSFVMPFDDRLIHLFGRLKGPFTIADDIEMRKVIV